MKAPYQSSYSTGQRHFTMASPSNRSQNRILGANLNPKQYRSSSCEIPCSNTMNSTTPTRSHRGSSPSCSHSVIINEQQRPLGRYHYLHQQQWQQQQQQQQQQKHHHSRGSIVALGLGLKPPSRSPSKSPSGSLDNSVLANAVRATATVGLSVSQTISSDAPRIADLSPNSPRPLTPGNIVSANDLPYILRSVSGERQDLRPGAPSEPNEYNFNFKKRGIFILINNRRFDESTGMQHREGSDLDAERLEERFQDIGFVVRRYDDVTSTKMISLMSDAASIDHSNHDCFGSAILSHGEEGIVFAKDGRVSLDILLLPFKADRCPSLVGKPKLFFIQACQSHLPSMHLEPSTSRRSPVSPSKASSNKRASASPSAAALPTRRVPVESDCLFCYSTVPGYFSWRNNQDGSWFIQALCQVLENYGNKMELMHMLTHVNRIVAYEFASCSDKEFHESMKHLPCIVSMLTRYVFFRPKKQDIR